MVWRLSGARMCITPSVTLRRAASPRRAALGRGNTTIVIHGQRFANDYGLARRVSRKTAGVSLLSRVVFPRLPSSEQLRRPPQPPRDREGCCWIVRTSIRQEWGRMLIRVLGHAVTTARCHNRTLSSILRRPRATPHLYLLQVAGVGNAAQHVVLERRVMVVHSLNNVFGGRQPFRIGWHHMHMIATYHDCYTW